MTNIQKVLVTFVVSIIVFGFVCVCDCLLEGMPQCGLLGKIVSKKYFRMAISYFIGLAVFLFFIRLISLL